MSSAEPAANECPECGLFDDHEYDCETAMRCEFGRYDEHGNVIFECNRLDYEEVPMADGDTVRLCRSHRSWGPALGEHNGSEGGN